MLVNTISEDLMKVPKPVTKSLFQFFIRYSRDKELNLRRYAKLTPRGPVSIASKDLKVGDIVYVEKVSKIQ